MTGPCRAAWLILMPLALAACSKTEPAAENTADLLENAADQSTPNAAEVLDRAADAAREGNLSAAPDDPDGVVQNAMRSAANAQASTQNGS